MSQTGTPTRPSLTLPGVPESIPRSEVLAMLGRLGLPRRDLLSFSMARDVITAEVRARHPDTGKAYLAEDGDIAMHHVHIAVTDD